ncbi:hypothetical protein DFH09DRAFT_1399740 [Mycena vulgaris]|nr:hypothetical protein DFH09DRAFT_1399740 [Mycena vulgaris]
MLATPASRVAPMTWPRSTDVPHGFSILSGGIASSPQAAMGRASWMRVLSFPIPISVWFRRGMLPYTFCRTRSAPRRLRDSVVTAPALGMELAPGWTFRRRARRPPRLPFHAPHVLSLPPMQAVSPLSRCTHPPLSVHASTCGRGSFPRHANPIAPAADTPRATLCGWLGSIPLPEYASPPLSPAPFHPVAGSRSRVRAAIDVERGRTSLRGTAGGRGQILRRSWMARSFPRLRTLTMTFDATALPTPSPPVSQRHLITTDVQLSPISAPGPVARFLSGIFPNLWTVAADVDEAAAAIHSQWRLVEALVPEFTAARKEGLVRLHGPGS